MKTFRMDTTQVRPSPWSDVMHGMSEAVGAIMALDINERIDALGKAHNASVYSMDKRIAALETKLNQATSVCNCTNRLLGLEQAVEALGRQLATLRAER